MISEYFSPNPERLSWWPAVNGVIGRSVFGACGVFLTVIGAAHGQNMVLNIDPAGSSMEWEALTEDSLVRTPLDFQGSLVISADDQGFQVDTNDVTVRSGVSTSQANAIELTSGLRASIAATANERLDFALAEGHEFILTDASLRRRPNDSDSAIDHDQLVFVEQKTRSTISIDREQNTFQWLIESEANLTVDGRVENTEIRGVLRGSVQGVNVSIDTPSNGASIFGLLILEAEAVDPIDGDISDQIVWHSNVDGEIGSGRRIEAGLSRGPHFITALANNAEALQSEAAINVRGLGTLTDSGQQLGNVSGASVALGDVDSDGDLDALVGTDPSVSRDSGFKQILLNDGNGNFTDSGQRLGSVAGFLGATNLVDIDKDGDLDAMFLVGIDFSLQIYLNDGQGNFSVFPFDQILQVGDFDVADLDGDGNLDFLIDTFQGTRAGTARTLIAYKGRGNLMFQRQTINLPFTDISDSSDLELVDLDGDGDIDVVSITDNHLLFAFNDGIGNFIFERSPISASGPLASVAAADLDFDGDIDLVTSDGTGSGETLVFENMGDRSFREGRMVGAADSKTISVALGDIDNDGDNDLLSAVFTDPNRVLLNDGEGSFVDSGLRLSRPTPRNDALNLSYQVALGDLDGDGDIDAFFSNASGINQVIFSSNL